MGNCDVFSLTHSPKNIGAYQNQFMWFFENNMAAPKSTFKRFRREDGAWEELLKEMGEYLQSYIPTHKLVSISLFEDAHPNEGKAINAVIAHIAGENPKM